MALLSRSRGRPARRTSTPGRIRTDTGTLLRGLPMPLGYGGDAGSDHCPLRQDRGMQPRTATANEARLRLPGDALVADGIEQMDRATTLPAPVDAVWPWIIQL